VVVYDPPYDDKRWSSLMNSTFCHHLHLIMGARALPS
jgi:hypothetical protein